MKRKPTTIPASSSALVCDRDGNLEFLLTDAGAPDRTLPRNTILLAAVLSLSRDDAWVEQTIALFERGGTKGEQQ